MNTHADKTSENKSQSVAYCLANQKSNSESTFQFVDKRPEAVEQRKLQDMANSSPQVKQLRIIQRMIKTNSSQKSPIQRKMVFGEGTKDLDASVKGNGITDSSFIKVQNDAKEIEPNIILALGAPSTSEQAKFQPYGQGGLISIKPLPDESHSNFKYNQTGRLIAVTHETQHALDHLHPESPMKGELSQLTGKKGVRTELHAFAAQSAVTQQLISREKPVEQKLRDMAKAYIDSTPDAPTEMLLNIMKYYAWYYSNKYKQHNPEFEKVQDSDILIRTTKEYIKEYLKESKDIYESLLSGEKS